MKKSFLYLPILFFIFTSFIAAGDFERRVEKVTKRPEFRHSFWGIEFYSAEKHKPLYTQNENTFFVPGSTTKLVTAGTALELLGPDYRFHTKIYRTGDITDEGVLEGDLVLVASGDPNLSGRVTNPDTLAFEDEDHSYGGEDSRGVPGDTLLVIRDFAKQIADHHVKRVTGSVIVDASLFQQGDRELGTGVVISPIIINDNVVDVLVTSGSSENAPAVLRISPSTAYARIINQVTTGKADSEADLTWNPDVENSDGSHTVTLKGSMPLGGKAIMNSYAVPDPTRYAETLLTEAMRERGIIANARLKEDKPDFKAMSKFYVTERQLAEHVSPPLTQAIKVVLKVSQNLHASMMPFFLSAVVGKKEAPQSGFDSMKGVLAKAGLDLSGASQSDGAGGSAHFTPAFMVSYLSWMATRPEGQAFHDALPILGRDGTLFQIQVNSPAAGHVFAKTGTYGDSDLLNQDTMVTGKGLAGYLTTKGGQNLIFAIYVNNVRVPPKPNAIRDIVGQALGEIAAAAYEVL